LWHSTDKVKRAGGTPAVRNGRGGASGVRSLGGVAVRAREAQAEDKQRGHEASKILDLWRMSLAAQAEAYATEQRYDARSGTDCQWRTDRNA
jgi:hypothetical protein